MAKHKIKPVNFELWENYRRLRLVGCPVLFSSLSISRASVKLLNMCLDFHTNKILVIKTLNSLSGVED